MIKYIKHIFIVFIVVLLTGCIRSNTEMCLYPSQFSFHFTKHPDGGDKLTKYIEIVNLYIYDDAGILVNSFNVPQSELIEGNRLNVYLPMGKYTAIAWGGVKESYSYGLLDSLSQASLSARRKPDNILSDFPEHLYYANISNMVVTNSLQPFTHLLDFQRNSKEIKMKVILIEKTPVVEPETTTSNDDIGGSKITTADIECVITASNGDYKFDNTILGEDQITYIPNRTEIANELNAHFFVLKLWDGDDSQLKITLNDPESGIARVIYNESLSELILLNQDIDLEYIGDLDVDIEINLSELESSIGVTIKINGWEVVDIETEI